MKKLLHSLSALALVSSLWPASFAQAQTTSGIVNAVTAATYTFVNTDCDPQGRKLVIFNNASGVAVTLPQAGTSGNFFSGCTIKVQNVGLGNVTITPTTSLINGGAATVVPAGSSMSIDTDNTNYFAQGGGGGGGGAVGEFVNFRNLLDNGAMNVAQRGTGATACSGTAGSTTTTYTADRWLCNVNVTSQAGMSQVVTASPTPPTGFQNALNVWRNSAALTQPVCMFQEVPTASAVNLQGQVATFSASLQALAGLSADNGNVVNMFIMTGTGTDEGLATLTASPAITPAFTGLASTITAAKTITTSWARYSVTGTIPATAKEIAVAICFTPTATGSGATDGFSMTGAQLEQGQQASSFEFRPIAIETALAQRYYWQIADAASTFTFPSSCVTTTANTTVRCTVIAPVTMRAVPTPSASVATSFGIILTAGGAGTCTTLAATASGSTVNSAGVTCTTGGTTAAGTGSPLIGAGTAGILRVSADF